ncbi:hypothetical protein EG68_10229 [Paragonimus skrjabini miyazakii]|uniref:DUF4806 domain-containing protein n=1 Tax=Paragonimus skrjabini miyazakii TaxID=59628 RepID=A0A8S9YSZ5_9TREM|nr:hypothetical protein EG68_10229 [Paragonimus skrjabini miyazakii]
MWEHRRGYNDSSLSGNHREASTEEAWSHIRTVDLDDSMRTVPMVAQSSPQKVLETIPNSKPSTSSKTTVPPLVDTDMDKSFGQVNTALLYRLSQDVHLLLLKVDMLEKLMRSKSGVDRSPNDDTKSLACLPFMAPYRTLTDFDTGEVILTSDEKRKTAMRFLSRYTGTTLGSLLRKVCQRLFTDDFAKIVGWTDKRNQGRQIKGSKILLTIQGKTYLKTYFVESIVNHPQLTAPIDAVDIFVKKWFNNARDRAGGRTKRYKSANKSWQRSSVQTPSTSATTEHFDC